MPNINGVLDSSEREIVASHGRSFASIDYALCEDGLIGSSQGVAQIDEPLTWQAIRAKLKS